MSVRVHRGHSRLSDSVVREDEAEQGKISTLMVPVEKAGNPRRKDPCLSSRCTGEGIQKEESGGILEKNLEVTWLRMSVLPGMNRW